MKRPEAQTRLTGYTGYTPALVFRLHLATEKPKPKKKELKLPFKIKELEDAKKSAAAHATAVNLGMNVVEQEVVSRDEAGHIKVIRKTFDTGQAFDYEVVERDEKDRIKKIRLIN